ncbi:hypothetical protein 2 [Beihai picorna-like virus 121]|uniref:hypothetical protein 2 n=1 Tax=Beihai picorna-like virus 121 TaxID=1922550 RepID=UPI00090BED7A|nr:hypothetical protein 2 [Beihai picorna-like virus 121]APG76779.1 hypothetical protein 2 [Beihai picorna-like virus 121]
MQSLCRECKEEILSFFRNKSSTTTAISKPSALEPCGRQDCQAFWRTILHRSLHLTGFKADSAYHVDFQALYLPRTAAASGLSVSVSTTKHKILDFFKVSSQCVRDQELTYVLDVRLDHTCYFEPALIGPSSLVFEATKTAALTAAWSIHYLELTRSEHPSIQESWIPWTRCNWQDEFATVPRLARLFAACYNEPLYSCLNAFMTEDQLKALVTQPDLVHTSHLFFDRWKDQTPEFQLECSSVGKPGYGPNLDSVD